MATIHDVEGTQRRSAAGRALYIENSRKPENWTTNFGTFQRDKKRRSPAWGSLRSETTSGFLFATLLVGQKKCRQRAIELRRLRLVVVMAGHEKKLFRLAGRLEQLPPHRERNDRVGVAMSLEQRAMIVGNLAHRIETATASATARAEKDNGTPPRRAAN